MSFRTRLTLFFVLIVIVPMAAVTVVLFRLVAENETGKADARVAEGQAAAIGLYQEFARRAGTAVRVVGTDERLAAALRDRRESAAHRRLRALLPQVRARRIDVTTGGIRIAAGAADAIAPARRQLVGPGGRSLGRVEVSVLSAREFARLAERITTFDVVVRRGARVLASTRFSPTEPLPARGHATLGGTEYRVVSFAAPEAGGPVRISVLSPVDDIGEAVRDDRLLIGLILLGFFVLASGFAVAVSRSLQAQIGRFLDAARRIGRGDFTTEVPTEGSDEFSDLGEEFNKMSRELESRLEELRQERARLEEAIRRIGDSFASNLDRDALLGIVVRTAVDGVGATCGRATALVDRDHGQLEERARAGDVDGLEEALHAVEAEALSAGQPTERTISDGGALAFPLRESGTGGRVVGLVSAVRAAQPFTANERELFNYLAGRAALSIENVGLHEHAQRQAITDELTGLSNHRRFQEVLTTELERSRRFDQELGLVLLDIDNFKQVNDTFGHQQGDRVLRAVARVMRETSREIDEPARYGGEEMAVALPQTDLEGTYQAAERMRLAIESMQVPLLNGDGVLQVTASFGVASVPRSAREQEALIAAADKALYAAKRNGKNRTVRATPA